MRQLLLTLVIVAVIAGGLIIQFSCQGVPAGTHLVVITVDTLRADHVGAYGYENARTPTIDGLASRGIRFTQAITPLPRTTPAIASLFTGLLPIRHGSREVSAPMRELPTLAAILRANGYATVGVTANVLLSEQQRMHQGFDAFEAKKMNAKEVTEEALGLVESLDSDAPLFLWVHYLDPHMPYLPPQEWAPRSESDTCQQLLRVGRDLGYSQGQISEDRDGIASAALATCTRFYDAEIGYTDHQIGKLLQGLERSTPGEPLLIVLTSDHGENLGEAGLYYEHGPNVHEASLRVPLIIAGPTIRARVDGGVIRLEDLTPTLLGLLEIPSHALSFDGIDLARRLGRWAWLGRGEETFALVESGTAMQAKYSKSLVAGHRRYFNCLHHGDYSLCQLSGKLKLFNHEQDPFFRVDLSQKEPERFQEMLQAREIWPPQGARERAVRTARFKFVEYPQFAGGYRRALYDLDTDPGETQDVQGRHPEIAAQLRAVLDAWTAQLPALADNLDEPTAEQLEALRALGYIE